LNGHSELLVIGIGNECRADDAAGLIAADRLLCAGCDTLTVKTSVRDGSALLYLWDGYDDVILIDAVRSDAAPGTIHAIDMHDPQCTERTFRMSGHTFSVFETVKLAGYINKAPSRIFLYAIEGANFDIGGETSDEVTRAVDEVVRTILEIAGKRRESEPDYR
jgi:hydrogenase maturation protease